MEHKKSKLSEENTSNKPIIINSFTIDDMRKAFEGGRDSVEAVLRYERFGDMDAYASKNIIKSFKTFIHENYRQPLNSSKHDI